jgi:hypothetical protein
VKQNERPAITDLVVGQRDTVIGRETMGAELEGQTPIMAPTVDVRSTGSL